MVRDETPAVLQSDQAVIFALLRHLKVVELIVPDMWFKVGFIENGHANPVAAREQRKLRIVQEKGVYPVEGAVHHPIETGVGQRC